MVQVQAQVEVRVFDPIGLAQVERNGDQTLTEPRHQMNAFGHEIAVFVKAKRAFKDRDRPDMHVDVGRLHIKKRRIEAAEGLHGCSLTERQSRKVAHLRPRVSGSSRPRVGRLLGCHAEREGALVVRRCALRWRALRRICSAACETTGCSSAAVASLFGAVRRSIAVNSNVLLSKLSPRFGSS